MLKQIDAWLDKYYKYLAIYVFIFFPIKLILEDGIWERVILMTTLILTVVNCYLDYKSKNKK